RRALTMRRKLGQTSPAGAAASGFDHHPFRSLSKLVKVNGAKAPAPPAPLPQSAEPTPEFSDEELFRREMADVRPMSDAWRSRVPEPPPTTNGRPITPDDAGVLAELSELVTGQGSFDISHSTEFVEGAVLGLDRRVLRRLRDGEFAYQSHLDLHGMTAQ